MHCLVTDEAMRIDETGPDVFRFKPFELLQQIVHRITSRKHAEDVFDSHAPPTNYGLSAEYFRVDVDAFQQCSFVHHTLQCFIGPPLHVRDVADESYASISARNRSGVHGANLTLTPVASRIAAKIAGAVGISAGSPTPLAP